MNVSVNGLNLIKQFEGCRLTAYKDPVGVWTIGYGTTNADKSITGLTIRAGVKITQAQADLFLEKAFNNPSIKQQAVNEVYFGKTPELLAMENQLDIFRNKYMSKYRFNQNQFDALVSFAYNIGSIDTLTNNGKRSIAEISAKITSYNKGGGKVLPGLVRRRNAEKALFNKPVSTPSIVPAPTPSSTSAKPATNSNYTTFVRSVQAAIGAKVDGIAGNETLGKTITVSAKTNKRHKVVKAIQIYLNSLGYNCGVADGVAGPKFTNAVLAFQKANGCVCDGIISARGKTWKKLLKLA